MNLYVQIVLTGQKEMNKKKNNFPYFGIVGSLFQVTKKGIKQNKISMIKNRYEILKIWLKSTMFFHLKSARSVQQSFSTNTVLYFSLSGNILTS